MTPQEVQAFVKANNIQIIDLKFIDLPGLWQHFSIPVSELDDGIFTSGLGFDGSSIRGFQKIQESDMLLIPDPATAVLDPVCAVPTLSMVCDIFDPIKKEAYSRDPRYIAKKAEAYLKTTGLGDTVYFGPEAEFFLFDDVRYESGSRTSYFSIDSSEAIWNSAAGGSPNLAYKIRNKEGYFPVPPHDTLQDIRSEMVMKMVAAGIRVEAHHHEVAGPGQCEIDMRSFAAGNKSRCLHASIRPKAQKRSGVRSAGILTRGTGTTSVLIMQLLHRKTLRRCPLQGKVPKSKCAR